MQSEHAEGYLTDEQYKLVYGNTPRLCVDIAVVNQNSNVALIRREQPPHEGLWHLPGGRVRMRESIADAVERIARDELAIGIRPDGLLGHMEFIHDVGELGDFHSVSLVFVVKGECSGDGTWFDDLPIDMHPTHREFLTSIDWSRTR